MKAQIAKVGSRGVDSFPYSQDGTELQALALKEQGIDFFIGYLGVLNKQRLAHIINAELAFMPVTLAGKYDGKAAVKACRDLELPEGVTVFLDLEGMPSFNKAPHVLISEINNWADEVKKAGYQPGLYVGSPQPLTADELFRLKVVRYWKAPSRVLDRNGKSYDGPACGFCMYQLWPQMFWRETGVFVDVDFIQQDFFERLPTWAIGD